MRQKRLSVLVPLVGVLTVSCVQTSMPGSNAGSGSDAGMRVNITMVNPPAANPTNTTPPLASPGSASCVVGETRACACSGAPTGIETCVTPSTWSTCGCKSQGGPPVAVPPVVTAANVCGGTQCKRYLDEETEVSARGCCTKDGACGSSSKFLFGQACVERGGDKGTEAADCGDEEVNFVSLKGCCRPDNSCGLSLDSVPNFDLGCIERTRMAKLLNDGAGDRNFLSLIFLLPIKPASFPAKSCSYRP
jgi:hypothetical protein